MAPEEATVPKSLSVPLMVPAEEGAQKKPCELRKQGEGRPWVGPGENRAGALGGRLWDCLKEPDGEELLRDP